MNLKKKYVIAHDVGTGSNKAALISADGEILASAEATYPFQYPQPGWVEQLPDDYWTAIIATTKILIKEAGIDPSEIIGLSFSTQAMGIIPVDREGKVLHPNITWVDGRAEDEARWLMKRFLGKEAFKALVGITITGKDVIPKLIWLKKNKPDIYQKTDVFLDVNGYLKFRATGKRVAEWSGACSYGFNLKKKDWERIFFKIAGIDLEKLPSLVKSTDKVGGLTAEAAHRLGLNEGTPVFGGCDDTQSAAVGTGSTGEGEAHIYLGTSAWVGVTTGKVHKFRHGAVCLQSADPEKNLVVGITESAGNNLEWLMDNFYKKEKEELGSEEIYKLIEKEAAQVSPGSDHLIFTPWLLGERCPVSTTTTRGTVFNLGLEHTRGHFVRALGEGIAFNLRWIIENFEKDFGFKISSLRITGGGSQNDQWMQSFADIIRHPVYTTNQPKMAGTMGASVCAFVGAGIFQDFDEVKKFVQTEKTFVPDKENEQIYNEMFISYKQIYKKLKREYKRINLKRFRTEKNG
jgi:xylulokinase